LRDVHGEIFEKALPAALDGALLPSKGNLFGGRIVNARRVKAMRF
jgi:hypothetical protein